MIIFTKSGWNLKVKESIKTHFYNRNKKVTESTKISDLNQKPIRKHIKFAWIMLIVSFISYYLYSMAYGGFIGLLSYTIAIRSGLVIIPNKFSFMEKFGQFSTISTYVFFAIFIDNNINKKNKKGTFLGFVLSMFFNLYFIYSRGGRGTLISFTLTLILITSYYNSSKLSMFFKKISGKLIWLPIVFIAMDRLWSRTGEMSLFSLLIKTLSYPFAAFIVNLRNGSYRFFKDFIQAPFYFLPSSIWLSKLNLKTADSQTTYLISGAYKGQIVGGRVITGTTPNDMLTFSYMQAGIFGVIIAGISFGIFLRYFHNKILKEKYDGIKYMLYSNFIARFVILSITGGDIAQIIISSWGFIIYFLMFSIYSKIRFI